MSRFEAHISTAVLAQLLSSSGVATCNALSGRWETARVQCCWLAHAGPGPQRRAGLLSAHPKLNSSFVTCQGPPAGPHLL